MKPVVATFTELDRAASAAERLHGALALPAADVSMATTAAYGEPYDGHTLVVAWVPDNLEEDARGIVSAAGGELHPQPWASPDGRQNAPAGFDV